VKEGAGKEPRADVIGTRSEASPSGRGIDQSVKSGDWRKKNHAASDLSTQQTRMWNKKKAEEGKAREANLIGRETMVRLSATDL